MVPSSEEITMSPGAVLAALEVDDVLPELPAAVAVAVGVLKRFGQLGASRTEP